MTGPWEFGWTQALSIIGLLIASFGLRTFARWRKEKIEEKRIETAVEAVTLARESEGVFADIRRTMTYDFEWADKRLGFCASQRPLSSPRMRPRERGCPPWVVLGVKAVQARGVRAA